MGFDLKDIKTDRDAEVQGVWTPDLGKGLKLKLGRMGNVEYEKGILKYTQEHMNAFGQLDMEQDVAQDALLDVYARTILLGWEGLSENEVQVEYSYDNAVRIMREYPEFFKLVKAQASRLELFKTKATEEDAGK